ncbi:membrane-associating domain-containing protein [Astrocystis sublimbata]|nr:membrane-associating domain-containing protein [Astrocystis sublimbata]
MQTSKTATLALRVAQATAAFVVLGLTAYVTKWYNVDTMSIPPPPIGWLLFVSLFTILSIGVLEGFPRFAPRFFHPYAALSLEFGNALFYLAGFVSLATYMSGLLFCRGSVCGAARADVAFGIIQFILWIASAALAVKDLFQKGAFRRQDKTKTPLGVSPMKEAPAP